MLKVMGVGGKDGIGGRFDQLGCLVCPASHAVTSLQVHE